MYNNLRSKLGYSKNSPWEFASENLIHSPDGTITMANTIKPLKAFDANTGKFLTIMKPGNNYKFKTNKILEKPLYQFGGTNALLDENPRRKKRKDLQKTLRNNYGFSGIIDENGKWIDYPTEQEAMKTMLQFMKNNWDTNAPNPSNNYRPKWQHTSFDPVIPINNNYIKLGGYFQQGGSTNDCPPGYAKDETGQCVEDNGFNPSQYNQKGMPTLPTIAPLAPQTPAIFHPEQEFDNGLADDNPGKRDNSLSAGSSQNFTTKLNKKPNLNSIVNNSLMGIEAINSGLSVFGNYLEEGRQKNWMRKQMAKINGTYSNAQNDYGVDPYEQTGQLRPYLKYGGYQKGGRVKFNAYDYLYSDDKVEDKLEVKSTPTKKQSLRITEDTEESDMLIQDILESTSTNINSNSSSKAPKGFRSFSSYAEGKEALLNQLNLYKTGKTRTGLKPTSTLYEAMAKYAPASDNNNPKQYAEFIAKRLGIPATTRISDLDTEGWAKAIEKMEGNKKGNNPGNLRPYQKGGVVDIDEQEIQKLINLGYKIERL